MKIVIEIQVLRNCIQQLHSLSRRYDSYTDVFNPGNFSVSGGTPLGRKLTDIRNNYRGIKLNIEEVARYIESYLEDLENVESLMGNLGKSHSFHTSLSYSFGSDTSGLIEKPYSFPQLQLFTGISSVTFNDTEYGDDVKFVSEEELKLITSGDKLIKNDAVQNLMSQYHLS